MLLLAKIPTVCFTKLLPFMYSAPLLWYSRRRDVWCLMSLNTPQEEQAGLKLGFWIWQCFSFCSPTPQTIISERSQSKGCPAVHRERGENSHVTDWKVSPPSCLTMWYSPTNLLSCTTSEEKSDKITKSLSLFPIPHTTVGYADQWDTKLCRSQE